MATSPDIKKDNLESQCDRELQVEEIGMESIPTRRKMYDIHDPPDAEDQFAMFPERAEGHENLVYVLMKLEGRTGHLPIVFCVDCAAEKYVQYCNTGAWEYQYRPCAIDKDFYCPRFYAELLRRIWTDHVNAGIWGQLLPTVSLARQHVNGCLHSSKPDFIIQRQEGLANSIYFRHCGGEFRNITMQTLELEGVKNATKANSDKWLQHGKNIGPHMVPGLEWKDTTRVQSTMFVDGITHL